MVKISVIIPVFNVEPYLQQCLESVVNQTLRDIEIICINDGSTDNSLQLLQEYAAADTRIKIIDKPNTGYGHSMNQGLKSATGEYIGIIESDDFAALDMFEKLYKIAHANDVEVVKSNYFSYRSHPKSFTLNENLDRCPYHICFSPSDYPAVFLTTASIWSGIYKTSFLKENEITFNETPGASYQDTAFMFKVWALAKRAFLTDEGLLYYRIDNLGSSINSVSKIFCVCDEHAEIERFLSELPDASNRMHEINVAVKYKNYRWNYERLSVPFQYAFLLKMEKELKFDQKRDLINEDFFSPLEISDLHAIIQDRDTFYVRTSKDSKDERLWINSNLSLQMYRKIFFETIEGFSGNIIFGAGVIGQRVMQYLVDEKKSSRTLCFAVSSPESPLDIMGLPVKAIDTLASFKEDYVVLVAIKERDQYEVFQRLSYLGFKHIIPVDATLMRALS
ncbi:glycosyltransferase [Paenibacillus sp. CAU 1782]